MYPIRGSRLLSHGSRQCFETGTRIKPPNLKLWIRAGNRWPSHQIKCLNHFLMRKLEISNPNGFLSMPQITSFDSIAHSVQYYFDTSKYTTVSTRRLYCGHWRSPLFLNCCKLVDHEVCFGCRNLGPNAPPTGCPGKPRAPAVEWTCTPPPNCASNCKVTIATRGA